MFINHCRTALTVFALCALLASVPGCLVAGGSKTTYTGTRVAQSTFEQIKPGTTTIGWVHVTLGEPTSKTKDGDDEVWKYTYTEQTESSGAVFLIFAGSSSNQTTNTVFIEFKDGVVINKWRG
jgi:outer membrane protein assembly factor BamE (lipoprotein component of BamABCDE complex)